MQKYELRVAYSSIFSRGSLHFLVKESIVCFLNSMVIKRLRIVSL